MLDTPQEERFDRITRTARRLLEVPISLVTLIDADRQWFKSCQGADDELRETPRDISFCGHAILEKRAFIIPDAARDKRFADNPLVAGPWHVRFYAGIPIATLSGQRVGTLCVIDTEPREPSEEDLDVWSTWGRGPRPRSSGSSWAGPCGSGPSDRYDGRPGRGARVAESDSLLMS